MSSPDWSGAIKRAQAHAPFLSRALERWPDLTALLASGADDAALAWARRAGEGAPDVATALRRERLALSLTLAIGDLAGAFALERIVGELTALADRALDQAIAEAIRHRAPDAEPAGFLALALGKHGAEELNFSSDIDPILLYDPLTLPRRDRDDPAEAAQRVARRVIQTLSHVNAEGYVFRVDLRLRPASEVSPLAIPIEAALTHYESSALAWERAAFIRARACAGDVAAGEAFLAAIKPFVWRKSLDFGAIAEVGRLTAQIRAEHGKVERPGPGYDVKRGRGGIREVEFFAQTHQLIHGGRNPALRLRGVRATLDALATAGLIDPGDADVLGDSYDRLRTIEHRLQMVADQQTHALPLDPAALDNVARLDGLPDGHALVTELEGITEAVGSRYDRLLADSGHSPAVSPPTRPATSDSLEAQLSGLGLINAADLAERIAGWRSGKVRALRSEAARAAFDAIQPALLAALASAPEPDRAFLRWEQLLTNLPSAVNLFRLLEARPALLQLLARILSLAPPLADALTRRADLLDPLIDASAFEVPGPVAELVRLMADADGGDYQHLLDRVRRLVGELRFTLGVQLIEAATDPLFISEALCRTAEAAIEVLARATVAEFERAHGRIRGSELVILGLGRLGGGALTHASDLDMVYLYSGAESGGESDGPRPLSAALYFNRLAQRVSASLSVPTAEGALYEVDTRLRPSGNQGPLAVSFSAFRRYQLEQAWTWEHMALTRARPLFGSPAARDELYGIVHDALRKPRAPEGLRKDVLEMRAEMARHKPRKGLLDAKLSRGGLVDLEFLVHYEQLRFGTAFHPGMEVAVEALVKEGRVPLSLVAARETLARLLVAGRLLAPDGEPPLPAARAVLAKACGYDDWQALLEGFTEARRDVTAAWAEVFGERLELEA